VLGTITGLGVGVVDVTRAMLGPFGGSRALHGLCILGLVVSLLALLGLLTAGLFGRVLRLGKGDGFLIETARSSVAAVPFVAFAVWVPSGWIRSQWALLDGRRRTLAVLALVVIALGVLAGARAVLALYRRRKAGRLGNAWMGGGLALSLLLAAGCYQADAVLYQGDYENFHYGLSVAFIGAVAFATTIAASFLPDRFAPRLPRAALLTVSVVLVVSFGLVVLAPARAFSKSESLVFTKFVATGRTLSDFDGDGHAGLFGGSDCAPLDVRVSSAGLEVPENGLDDDCSGKDASWPTGPRPVEKHPLARRPNVVLITVDALRADHLGIYGYGRKTSPAIDRLAARSLVFTEAYAQAPKTVDSVPSFLTGAYPSNVPRDYRESRRRKAGAYELAADARPLAEMLHAAGYATGAGPGFRLLQLERGFEVFEVSQPTATALRFLDTTNVPFFLWLHYAEPHVPYVRHREHDFGSSAVDRYDSEIATVDTQIDQVLDALKKHDLLSTTVVIISADHGEEFLEHGGTSHTRKLYRELLHVPLILHVPGIPGRRVRGPVELVDIVPTVAELTGITLAPGTIDGESLLVPTKRTGQFAYAEDLREKSSVIAKRSLFDGRYRLIDDREADRMELYDDRRDPKEQRDLALKNPAVVARLRELLSVHALRRHTEPMKRLAASADAATWAELLPTFRRPEVLEVALDRFPKARAPERDAVLTRLLDRRDLAPKVAEKARALLGQ
jgi:arylsulfatase A-like enzyme